MSPAFGCSQAATAVHRDEQQTQCVCLQSCWIYSSNRQQETTAMVGEQWFSCKAVKVHHPHDSMKCSGGSVQETTSMTTLCPWQRHQKPEVYQRQCPGNGSMVTSGEPVGCEGASSAHATCSAARSFQCFLVWQGKSTLAMGHTCLVL